MKNTDNIKIYDHNAKKLVARYQSTTTENALPAFINIMNAYSGLGRTALDIGSGSGRDAFWMAERGWKVNAIDGSKQLLKEAEKLHAHPSIHYIYDHAPDFIQIQNQNKHYNVILMAAFIFHFEYSSRISILQLCKDMLASSGLIHISLRNGPELRNQAIFNVDVKEMEYFAKQNNLSLRYHGRAPDSSGLDDIAWDYISLWQGSAWDHAMEFSL